MPFEISKHFLVPKHVLLSKGQAEELVKKLGTDFKSLPQISKDDPAIADFKPVAGEVVKIVRDSFTAGKSIYYRRVV